MSESPAVLSDNQRQTLQSAPSNYGAAVARALEWLGDRYLLARPINAPRPLRRGDRKPAANPL